MTFKKVALRAGLYSSAAIAAFVAFETAAQAGTLTSSTVTYAGLSVSANSGVVTLPAYTYTLTSTSALPYNGESLVITFPSGITESTTPGVVLSQVCSTAATTASSTYAPTYSNNTVTISFPNTATALCAGANSASGIVTTVTLPSLTVAGASALGVSNSSTATFTVTAKLTSVSTVIADATAVSNTSITAVVGGSSSTTASNATSLSVSLSTANLGTKFAGSTNGTSLASQLATAVGVSNNANTKTAADPTATFTLGSSSVGLTLSGTFPTGIASAYLAPTGTTTCSTTVPSGSYSSTGVTAGSITFGTINATSWGSLCLIATGTGIIQPSTNVLGFTLVSGTATVSLASQTLQGYTFSGGSVKSLPYLIGAQAGYASVIRLINTDTTNAASVFLSVTNEAGTNNLYQATPLTSVAAGTSLTTTLEGLGTAGSTTFLASGARGSANLLIAGTTSVSAQAYILQPGNLLLNVGAGQTVTSTTGTQTATYSNSSGTTSTFTLTIPGATSTSGNAISF